jgi:hypothetical protein
VAIEALLAGWLVIPEPLAAYSTDHDRQGCGVRAAKAMGAHKVVQPTTKTSAGTVLYRVNVYGTVAADLMRSLLPHMGERRSRKITKF